jgi:predicted secreted protein
MRLPYPLFLSLLLVAALPSHAEDTSTYNRVTLEASASATLPSERMTVALFAESDGPTAAGAADDVNRRVAWALEQLAGRPGIEYRTLDYRTHPLYEQGKLTGWRVRQGLQLDGGDHAMLGELTSRLQAQLGVESVSYGASEETRRDRLDDLTRQALQAFTARAASVAEALGRRDYRLVRIEILDGGTRPQPIMRAMAAETMPVAAARFEPGSQPIEVTIRGEIELTLD